MSQCKCIAGLLLKPALLPVWRSAFSEILLPPNRLRTLIHPIPFSQLRKTKITKNNPSGKPGSLHNYIRRRSAQEKQLAVLGQRPHLVVDDLLQLVDMAADLVEDRPPRYRGRRSPFRADPRSCWPPCGRRSSRREPLNLGRMVLNLLDQRMSAEAFSPGSATSCRPCRAACARISKRSARYGSSPDRPARALRSGFSWCRSPTSPRCGLRARPS